MTLFPANTRWNRVAAWRGRVPGRCVVVLFNAERQFWITGFQADEGHIYVDQQGGFWLKQPS